MKKSNLLTSIRIFTVLILVLLPLFGSDCQNVINQLDPSTVAIQGNWTLIYNAGTLRDICPGESVSFPSNSDGTATLTCPEQTPITRSYTVSGTTLKYTASGVEYTVDMPQSDQLVLTGINNTRVLYYSTTITDKNNHTNTTSDKNSINYNSSEITK
ncbi:MAG: hypothetical protein IT280_08185 [Ignavibacteria bacterium]|nr:hypothetical protein [Ignavibacteria bacterium]